jgi:hypothetical protein
MFIRGVARQHLRNVFSECFSYECPDEAASALLYLQQTPKHIGFAGFTGNPPAEVVMSRIIAEAGGSTLTIRWQDGDSWQITLKEGTQVVADFNSDPRCYDEERDQEAAFRAGRTIAARWGLAEERIIEYFRYFEDTDEEARAYPEDEHRAGGADQLHDFMRAADLRFDLHGAYTEQLILKPASRPNHKLQRAATSGWLSRVFSAFFRR